MTAPSRRIRRARDRLLEPLHRYAERQAVLANEESSSQLRSRIDDLEQQCVSLHAEVGDLQAMKDLPATLQEVVVALADRIETIERELHSSGRSADPMVSSRPTTDL